jgi:hypothetical protein
LNPSLKKCQSKASSVCLVISFVPRNKDVKNQNKVLEDNILIISLISIGKLMILASFNTFYIFTNQLYHINDRNFAFSFCSSVGRLGFLISPQINLLGDIIWKPLPFIIFSISAIFAAIFNFYYQKNMFEKVYCFEKKFILNL